MKKNILDQLVTESQDLENLVNESMNLGAEEGSSVILSKAHTVALYDAITNKIYSEIVKILTTESKVANVFLLENINRDGTNIINTTATYSGAFGISEREELENDGNIFPDKEDYTKGDYFLFEDRVLQAVEDNPFDGLSGTTPFDKMREAFFKGTIRYVSDSSISDHFDDDNRNDISSSFKIHAWRGLVGSRKTKINITYQALQDLSNSLRIDGESVLIDSIANIIAEDINKDVIHKLITISQRYRRSDSSSEGYIDLSNDSREGYILGRELYSTITDMIAHITSTMKYTPNYVVVSPRVAGLINSSGMARTIIDESVEIQDKYILKGGTTMRVDATAEFDYILVGVNSPNISSIYMSKFVYPKKVPFIKALDNIQSPINFDPLRDFGTFTLHKAVNTENFSNSYMCLSRYALSAPPFALTDEEKEKMKDGGQIIYGDRWDILANKSPLSLFTGVVLPDIITE